MDDLRNAARHDGDVPDEALNDDPGARVGEDGEPDAIAGDPGDGTGGDQSAAPEEVDPEPGPVFAAFATGYDFALDPYQVAACAHIEAGSGVLVAAPTGAGKTVAGEFAIFLALQQGRKAFYTTPIKALSNQKYHDLVERHGPDNVGLLTGDTSLNSEAPIVVMTTEVLRNMIYARSRTLNNLGFVVMDEVHYLADRFRGAVWEEVIIGLADSVQLVALSATVSNAEEFGDWLAEVRGRMAIVVSERRPVPLYQHVMAGRRLYDLFVDEAPTALPQPGASSDVNPELTKLAKEESRFVRDDSRRQRGRRQRDRIDRNAKASGQRHPNLIPRRDGAVEKLEQYGLLPAIYFIFSRQGCDQAVGQLMHSGLRLTTAHERAQLEEIANRHCGALSRSDLDALDYPQFLEALRRGVAAHHAGLLPAFKECVEEAFVRGLVKVVFATETLALGINMPARSVVLEKLVKYNGEALVDITPGEYTQLTGRAGRRGIDVEGHAVVLWQRNMDPRQVAGLASRRTYPLKSSFSPTYNMSVNLVGAVGRERARTLLEQSFAQYQSDRSVVGLARGIARNEDRIARLWDKAACERGDFREYAGLRAEISRLEAEAARSRRADRHAETLSVLLELSSGDILRVPSGRHEGWAVVIDPGTARNDREGPRPLVMTEERQVKRLSLTDFPSPPPVVGRMRVPKHFNAKEPASRRNLFAAFRSRLESVDLTPERYRPGAMDAEVAEQIDGLRHQMRAHPCHSCPAREEHARFAEQAQRLERDSAGLRRQSQKRTNTIAVRFDRICSVLRSLGYLGEDGETVTDAGRMLARIYCELDLVAAECVRAGIFDELSAPEFAAVISTLIYEARGRDQGRPARMPNRSTEIAQSMVLRIWREVGLLERDQRLDRHRDPDLGFAQPVFAWASGRPLAQVLGESELTAGDFVRWTRQVIDLAGQIATAAGPGRVRTVAREAVDMMRRGVVDAGWEED
ncbi:DEAD/DEAH box helicase [Nigerium massiliense]|uniref:DEAD/DEAH box helicase n=1 Tax=Nigerium massiliense TaxID=1522317 RepID=UPI000B177575|nr:DEAD/DEAH box helicase [Nigerium massiliense]